MKFLWQQIPSTVISEMLCHLNSDGVVLDTEHACFNNETLYSCIQTIKLSKKKCFVRLTEISNTMVRHCLDAGADGIIFSTIETEEQAKLIIKYGCFPPKGKRGLGLVRQNMWGEKELISKDPVLIPQIETKKGIDNLNKIIKFNFDYYLIGPYDLSLSLGIPGQLNNELFIRYAEKVENILPHEKLAVHIPRDIKENIEKFKNYGLQCLGMDTTGLLDYFKEILNNA